MDETYWQQVVAFMRQGMAVTVAHDMAFGALRLREHFAALDRQRRNEAA